MEVALAKPQVDKKPDYASNSFNPGLLPSLPPYPAYGYTGDPYGAYGGGYGAAGFGQVGFPLPLHLGLFMHCSFCHLLFPTATNCFYEIDDIMHIPC